LTVTGLSTGDQVRWTTDGTHDRVLIENISAHDLISGNDNNTFDIGGFSLVQAQPAPDEKLDFTPTPTAIQLSVTCSPSGSMETTTASSPSEPQGTGCAPWRTDGSSHAYRAGGHERQRA
jgi:hypothetical protein